jgi:hypothetical protein
MIVILLAVIFTNQSLATRVTILNISYPSVVKYGETFNVTVSYSSISYNLICTAQAYLTTGQVGSFGPYSKETLNMPKPGNGNVTLSMREVFGGVPQVYLTFEILSAIGLGLASKTVTLNVTSS